LSIFSGQRVVFPHATFMIRNIDLLRKKSNFMSAASNDLKSDPKQTSHSSWRNLLKADLVHYAREAKAFQGDRPGRLRAIGILLTPSLMCCALHRLAHAAFRRGWTRAARAIARTNAIVHRTVIDPAAEIGPGLYIPHPTGVVFLGTAGANLSLYIFAFVSPREPTLLYGADSKLCPRIGNDVSIGARAMVIGPVLVGDGSRIGPNAIANRDVAPGSALIVKGLSGRLGTFAEASDETDEGQFGGA
jgi:serine O-acetyltransferase